MSQLYQQINYEVTNRVATISLNRPEQGNALNDLMIAELKDALQAAQVSGEAKVILLRANGPAFCLGTDAVYLEKVAAFSHEQHQADSASFAQLLFNLYRSPKVVVCQIQGDAMAEGAALATVCDLTIVSSEARIGFPEVRYGQAPALILPILLRKLGETKAKELMLTGDLLGGSTATEIGLFNQAVAREELEGRVQALTSSLCQNNSFAAMQLTKKMIVDIQDFPFENAMKFAAKMNAHSRLTEDFRKGVHQLQKGGTIKW